jgi:hypothetical protein
MKPLPQVVGYIATAGAVASGILAFLSDPAYIPFLAEFFSAALLAKTAALCGLIAGLSHSLTGTGGK